MHNANSLTIQINSDKFLNYKKKHAKNRKNLKSGVIFKLVVVSKHVFTLLRQILFSLMDATLDFCMLKIGRFF